MTAYQRVITHITQKIDRGEWLPGARLPSAEQLSRELGIGTTTVVNALRSLQVLGVIVGRTGSGRFVAGNRNAEPTGNDVV